MLTEQAAEKGLPHVAGDVVSTAVADNWAWTRFIGNEPCMLFIGHKPLTMLGHGVSLSSAQSQDSKLGLTEGRTRLLYQYKMLWSAVYIYMLCLLNTCINNITHGRRSLN
jgi:hypothetical protein